jgi:hypothetical protein
MMVVLVNNIVLMNRVVLMLDYVAMLNNSAVIGAAKIPSFAASAAIFSSTHLKFPRFLLFVSIVFAVFRQSPLLQNMHQPFSWCISFM